MNGASPPNSRTARLYVSAAPVERTPTGNTFVNAIGKDEERDAHLQHRERLERSRSDEVVEEEARSDTIAEHTRQQYRFAPVAVGQIHVDRGARVVSIP
jgi:hypothetical protein